MKLTELLKKLKNIEDSFGDIEVRVELRPHRIKDATEGFLRNKDVGWGEVECTDVFADIVYINARRDY